jgi:hypothetical protein
MSLPVWKVYISGGSVSGSRIIEIAAANPPEAIEQAKARFPLAKNFSWGPTSKRE